MAKLFPAYMWLKGKTQNWTATNSQDSFTSKFCKCPDSAPRFHRWIDLVDITGQQRMRFTFCKCIPRPVQILANGFLPSSPDEPTTGFSMRLLAYHNHAWHYSNVRMTPFAETQQVFNEERSETLWNKGQSAELPCRNHIGLSASSGYEPRPHPISPSIERLAKTGRGDLPSLFWPNLEYRPPSTPLSCQPLKHFTRWELVGTLTLLWKAKSDLFATAVDVRAERQPLISTNSGNILGTRLKEKIMAAIQRRSKPVDRAIKLFNQRRREYLQKYDPSRLRLPENKDMTLSEFQSMDLDDPLWNDGHFYHTRAPWATDPLVRGGIRSVHLLNRVEEEIELITQELDRAITWAHSYHGLILSKISLIELAAEEPVDVNNVEFSSFLTGFSMKGSLRLLHSELKLHLNEHERLMVGWMPDVRFLWTKTRCQYTKSEHPWFNVIETVKKHLNGADMAFIDDALENLTFAENGTNVEEQEQAENNAQDFEIPANEQPSDEGVDGEGRDGNEDGNSVMNTNAGAA
ncbi:hypothetical protein MJO28_017381 [Puccinia striiformis f. sp. tritici]|nr:hypothetical protein MJO28_017381 [Puccinia striiformis f. sp. tritici]KAI9623904.1 hypothetical protein KEM48_009279 [Puccinia striiformis f. sp. tritici PST-130]